MGRSWVINTSGLSNGAAITIPADLAWKTAEILARHGQIKRGYLGIRSQAVDIPGASQDALKRKQATGLLIMSVEKIQSCITGWADRRGYPGRPGWQAHPSP